MILKRCEVDEIEYLSILLDVIQAMVELPDPPPDVMGEDWVSQAQEEPFAAPHVWINGHRLLPPLHGLELTQIHDVGGIVHGALELPHPHLHMLIGDAPPLSVG